MAQSVKHPTLDFGSGHDLRVREFEPTPGSALTVWSLLRILPLTLSLCPSPLMCSLFLKINKHKKKRKSRTWQVSKFS